MRHYGWAKNLGPQYIRGIFEGNGNVPGEHMWNIFSVNKEDIWVTRTRVPITGTVDRHVNQNFERVSSEADLELWNFYVPKWAPVEVVTLPGGNHVLQLCDEDPYDYACVERAFPASNKGMVEFSIHAADLGKDILEFELHNEKSQRALRVRFDSDQEGITFDLGGVEPESTPLTIGKWYDVKISFNCRKGEYDLWLNGKKVGDRVELDVKTATLERMVFRTGSWRADVRQLFLGGEPSAPGLESEDLPASDKKVPRSLFWIDNVKTSKK